MRLALARASLLGALCLEAFGAAAQSSTVPQLIVQLQSPDPIVRDGAVRQLGHSADPRAVPALIAILRDPNINVGNDAATALGELHAAAAIPALVRNLQYAPCGNNDGVAAAKALAAIGPPALPALVQTLRKTHPLEGTYIAFAIGQALDDMPSRRVLPALLPLLNSPDPSVRSYTLERISHHPGPAAVSAALQQLHRPRTTESALGVLAANLNDPRTRPALLGLTARLTRQLTVDHGEKFKPVGSGGLYMLVGPEMNDDNDSSGVRALHLLAKMHDTRLLALFLNILEKAPQREDPPLGLGEIVSIGPSAIPPLIRILSDPRQPENRRGTAALALGSFDDPRVIPPLLAATRNPSRAIREGAFEARIVSKDPIFLDSILDALAHDRWGDIRQFAAEALRTQHDPRIGPALIAALQDKEQAVRISAIHSVSAQHNTDAVPALIDVMRTRAPGIDSDAAGQALGQLAVDSLRQPNVITEQPALVPEVRRNLAQAGRGDSNGHLEKLNLPPVIVPSDADPEDTESRAALTKTSDDAAQQAQEVPPLQPLLQALHDPNPSARLAAARALQYREEPEATRALVPLLRDTDSQVRQAAAKALTGCPNPDID